MSAHHDKPAAMRCFWLVLGLWCVFQPTFQVFALDDTEPLLRWGASVGISGSIPIGDRRGPAAREDEHTNALWLNVEPLSFELKDSFGIYPYALFRVAGGVNPDAIDAGLNPMRRKSLLTKKPLDDPEPSMLQLGLKGRWFALRNDRFRVYGLLGLAYATAGARYPASATSLTSGGGGFGGGAAGVETVLHRHRGVALPLGVGVRYDLPIRAFNTNMLVPIALELSYTHNFWLDLQGRPSIETMPDKLVGEKPFLDYLGLTLNVGFLR